MEKPKAEKYNFLEGDQGGESLLLRKISKSQKIFSVANFQVQSTKKEALAFEQAVLQANCLDTKLRTIRTSARWWPPTFIAHVGGTATKKNATLSLLCRNQSFPQYCLISLPPFPQIYVGKATGFLYVYVEVTNTKARAN